MNNSSQIYHKTDDNLPGLVLVQHFGRVDVKIGEKLSTNFGAFLKMKAAKIGFCCQGGVALFRSSVPRRFIFKKSQGASQSTTMVKFTHIHE